MSARNYTAKSDLTTRWNVAKYPIEANKLRKVQDTRRMQSTVEAESKYYRIWAKTSKIEKF